MPDLSSVAREAAEAEGLRRGLPQEVRTVSGASIVLVTHDYGVGFQEGFTECASRLPSEAELARVIDAAIYVSINPLLDRGAWKAAQRAARDVASLIGEKISG